MQTPILPSAVSSHSTQAGPPQQAWPRHAPPALASAWQSETWPGLEGLPPVPTISLAPSWPQAFSPAVPPAWKSSDALTCACPTLPPSLHHAAVTLLCDVYDSPTPGMMVSSNTPLNLGCLNMAVPRWIGFCHCCITNTWHIVGAQ